jgi:hypothetical protein
MRKILLILDKFFFIYTYIICVSCCARFIFLHIMYDSSGNAQRNNLGYTIRTAYLTIEVIYAI